LHYLKSASKGLLKRIGATWKRLKQKDRNPLKMLFKKDRDLLARALKKDRNPLARAF